MSIILDRWNKAKENFESKTGVKKPKGNKKVFGFSVKSTGIEKSLTEVEALLPLSLTASGLKKTESAFNKLKKNGTEYIKVLSDAINDSEEGDEKATYKEQCHILKLELDYCVNYIEGQVIIKRGFIKKWGAFVKVAKQLENSLILAHRLVISAISEVKAAPSFATWNRVMSNDNPPALSLVKALKGFDDILEHSESIEKELKNDQSALEDFNAKIKMAKLIIEDYQDAVAGNSLPYGIENYAYKAVSVFKYDKNALMGSSEKDFILEELRKFAVRIKNIHERFIKPFDKYEDTLGDI